MEGIGGVANDLGALLAAMFGGATPYPVEIKPEAAAQFATTGRGRHA